MTCATEMRTVFNNTDAPSEPGTSYRLIYIKGVED